MSADRLRAAASAQAARVEALSRRSTRWDVLKSLFLLLTFSRRIWGSAGLWGKQPRWDR